MRAAGSPARAALLALLGLLLAGCATTIPPGAGQHAADPWEVYNRHMFEFNDRVDRAVTRPIARFYAEYFPMPARDCIGNVFNNFNDVPSALNNLLQGKPAAAMSDLCRVAINSTVGLLGCFDLASRMGLQRSDEDFGQTLGRWGSAPGPYFVWPLLGPSSVRDSVGRVVGFYTDPMDYLRPIALRNLMTGLRVVDTRAQLLPVDRLLDMAALDRYQFVRDAFLQRRNSLVFDGNPPRLDLDFDNDEPLDKPTAPARDPAPAGEGDRPQSPVVEAPAAVPAAGTTTAATEHADQPTPSLVR